MRPRDDFSAEPVETERSQRSGLLLIVLRWHHQCIPVTTMILLVVVSTCVQNFLGDQVVINGLVCLVEIFDFYVFVAVLFSEAVLLQIRRCIVRIE